MEIFDRNTLALLVLLVLGLGLGGLVQRRSLARQPLQGGVLSALFSLLASLCLVAILPTVCMTVLVLQPEHIHFAGRPWTPLLLIVPSLGLGSIFFSLLHGLFERGPARRAQQAAAAREARGWTEADAKSSGL